MSKMAELAYDIESLYCDGVDPRRIARILGCNVQLVYDWIDSEGLDVVDMQQEDDKDHYFGA